MEVKEDGAIIAVVCPVGAEEHHVGSRSSCEAWVQPIG
jgi:hypothetical protein